MQVAVSVSNLNATAEGARQVAAAVATDVIQAVLQVSDVSSGVCREGSKRIHRWSYISGNFEENVTPLSACTLVFCVNKWAADAQPASFSLNAAYCI